MGDERKGIRGWLTNLRRPSAPQPFTPDPHSPNIMSDKYLIVGLGNPGRKYRGNRHNIGFMAVDLLANEYGISSKTTQNKAIVGNGRIQGKAVILAKPQTFMNSSGDSVGPLAKYFKIPNENILVIYDELDLPFGTIRLREKGGAGGHNGMKSIINHLGQDFARMRLRYWASPGTNACASLRPARFS